MTGQQFKTILAHIKETQGVKYANIVESLDIPQSTYYYYRDESTENVPMEVIEKLLKTYNLSTEKVTKIIEESEEKSKNYDKTKKDLMNEIDRLKLENTRLNELIDENNRANLRLIKTVSQMSDRIEELENRVKALNKRLNG